jgi:hypothetical protein
MIGNLDAVAGAQPQLPFVRPTGDEFQIGEFLIRRIRGDKFLIWNRDHEMLETDAGKLESELNDFFNEEF